MKIDVSDCRLEDAESLARLLEVLGYPMSAEFVVERMQTYQDEFSRIFVARAGDEVVGFLSFHAIPLFHATLMLGRVTAMAIDPSHQRKGVGARLIQYAEKFAVSAGCSRMEVTSGDHREGDAHVFYQRMGYQSDCRRFLKTLGESLESR